MSECMHAIRYEDFTIPSATSDAAMQMNWMKANTYRIFFIYLFRATKVYDSRCPLPLRYFILCDVVALACCSSTHTIQSQSIDFYSLLFYQVLRNKFDNNFWLARTEGPSTTANCASNSYAMAIKCRRPHIKDKQNGFIMQSVRLSSTQAHEFPNNTLGFSRILSMSLLRFRCFFSRETRFFIQLSFLLETHSVFLNSG